MVVDKKMSNIAINIPPVKVPETNITFNISKNAENIKIEPDIKNTNANTNVRINDINNTNNTVTKEQFTVSDAQDTTHYNKIKEEVLAEPDTFSDQNKTISATTTTTTNATFVDNRNNLPTINSSDDSSLEQYRKDRMERAYKINPPFGWDASPKEVTDITCSKNDKSKSERGTSFQIVDNVPRERYQKGRLEKAYITAADFGWDSPPQAVSCSNSSIAQKYKSGNKTLLPYQIGCGHPNKLTAENYYKTHYKMQVVPIEDYHVRGANYMDYNTYPTPYQTRNMWILSKNTKGLPPEQTKYPNIPTGYNYAFHNTPAMPMP